MTPQRYEMTPEDLAAAKYLDEARADHGMSKAEMARRAGISERGLKYYLAGDRPMTLGTFHTLRAVLRLSRQEAARGVAAALLSLDHPSE